LYAWYESTKSPDVPPVILSVVFVGSVVGSPRNAPVTFCMINWFKSKFFWTNVPVAPDVPPVIVSPNWNNPVVPVGVFLLMNFHEI
jgi:hypothetical protein